MESPTNIRHGDVGLFQVASLPAGAAKVERKGDIVLALGEVTGHAHRIKAPTVSLWEVKGQRYVVVEEAPAGEEAPALSHEEHGIIPVPPGIYEARIQRTYTPEGDRQVAD